MERICRKCSGTEFYSYGQCKPCARKNANAYRAANLDRVRAYDRKRYTLPQRRQYTHQKAVTYVTTHPKARSAHTAVSNAVRDGRLQKGPCEVCQTGTGVHAHHDDYDRPLSVRWLCTIHHAEWHRENGPGKNLG